MLDIEEPPSDLPPELQAYLRRMFISIAKEMNKDVVVRQWDRLPSHPQQFTFAVFKSAIPGTTILHPGLHYYQGTEWHPFP